MATCTRCNGVGELPSENAYQQKCWECYPPGIIEPYTVEELVSHLRDKYGDYTVPPCRVCGAPLSIASAGAGLTEYVCSAARSVSGELEHYQKSKWTAPNFPDRIVVALCDLVAPKRS